MDKYRSSTMPIPNSTTRFSTDITNVEGISRKCAPPLNPFPNPLNPLKSRCHTKSFQLIVVIAALLLTACGGAPAAESPTAAPAPQATSAPTAAAQPTAAPAATAAPP